MGEVINKENYFTKLNTINVTEHIEKKNGLSYLSWPWAWAELKKADPNANYRVMRNELGWNYFVDNNTGWVEVGVTAFGIEHTEMLPIMDYKNQPIKKDLIDSFDVNKSIQRCLVKAIARHGIGLYIYAGEDLPEEPGEQPAPDAPKADAPKKEKKAKKEKEAPKVEVPTSETPSSGKVETSPVETVVTANAAVPAAEKPAAPQDVDASAPDADGVVRTLPEYIRLIGKMVTNIKVNEGTTENYLKVVEEVTGERTFKVKYATKDDIVTVVHIYNLLIKAGYGA